MPRLFTHLGEINQEDWQELEPERYGSNSSTDDISDAREAARLWAQGRRGTSSRITELDESGTDAFASTVAESSGHEATESTSNNVPIVWSSQSSSPSTPYQHSRNQSEPIPAIHSQTSKDESIPGHIKEEPQDVPQYATGAGPAQATTPSAASASAVPPPTRPKPWVKQGRARRRNQQRKNWNHNQPNQGNYGISSRTNTQEDPLDVQHPAPRGPCRRHTGLCQPQAKQAFTPQPPIPHTINLQGATFSITGGVGVQVNCGQHRYPNMDAGQMPPFTSPMIPTLACLRFDPKYYDVVPLVRGRGRQGIQTKRYRMFCATCGCHATEHATE
ncbi:hypothetical protein DFH27DRAFT_605801 [Peziza echinospora]|nr:hypothetical protein DFH27DRAFT_605801 [Peziza echinospora]